MKVELQTYWFSMYLRPVSWGGLGSHSSCSHFGRWAIGVLRRNKGGSIFLGNVFLLLWGTVDLVYLMSLLDPEWRA